MQVKFLSANAMSLRHLKIIFRNASFHIKFFPSSMDVRGDGINNTAVTLQNQAHTWDYPAAISVFVGVLAPLVPPPICVSEQLLFPVVVPQGQDIPLQD